MPECSGVDRSDAEVIVAFTAAELYELTEQAAAAGAAGASPGLVAQNAVASAEIGRACARARQATS